VNAPEMNGSAPQSATVTVEISAPVDHGRAAASRALNSAPATGGSLTPDTVEASSDLNRWAPAPFATIWMSPEPCWSPQESVAVVTVEDGHALRRGNRDAHYRHHGVPTPQRRGGVTLVAR
jgi:hypothetical protein